MKDFLSMKFFLAGLTLITMLSACSNDETPEPTLPEPTIQISALESEIGALNFSIDVENAEQCAYVCLDANEPLPTTADEIFATGTSVKLTDKNKLSIRVPVDKQIAYAVIAAAANQTGKAVSNKLQLTPLEDSGPDNPEPKPEQIDVTFSTGELLYLPNGMLLINLLETDDTSVYQTQIKLEGIENNGALKNGSRLLAEGLYKTITPSYLIDIEGDSDIDDNLPTGTLVKIERGTANNAVLTVTGTLSKSETKFTGRFSGILENEMELKNYSLNDVIFDETGGGKWNAEKKVIEIPFRSSAYPELKQFSLVFRSETETLAAGDYPISENGEAGTVSLAKAYFDNAPVYIDGTLAPSEIGYKTGSVKVVVNPTTNEYTLTIDVRDSYDIIYQENTSAQVVYGGTLTGSFKGSIVEQGGGEDPDPQYDVWQDTYSKTPAVVSYGLTSELEGYEHSYIGCIDLQPDTAGEANMRLYFVNRDPNASADGFDPSQIEFIPGYSFCTLGQDLNDPIFPYVLMEGDIQLSYDSGSQKWTLHYEGFFVAPLGHKIKVVADYVGPMDGFTAL